MSPPYIQLRLYLGSTTSAFRCSRFKKYDVGKMQFHDGKVFQ